MEAPEPRTLDFTVIGAQRAGTTSLWMYMRTHSGLCLPSGKEAAFFARKEKYEQGLGAYLADHFSFAPEGAKLGTVTPHYMAGTEDTSLETVVERMHETVPDIRLIALLRDPIERAFSEYRLTVHRGLESRQFSKAMRRQLEPGALEEARATPSKGTTYITQGEYGRILDVYLQRFSRDQLLVLTTDELHAHPKRTMRKVFEFLEVDRTHVPGNLDQVYFRGGTSRRVSAKAADELRNFLAERIWQRIPDSVVAHDAEAEFAFWFQQWNVVPNPNATMDLHPGLRRALQTHFRADAERLSSITNLEPPWIDRWAKNPGASKATGSRRRAVKGAGSGSRKRDGRPKKAPSR